MTHVYTLKRKGKIRKEVMENCTGFMDAVNRILLRIEILGLSDWRVVGHDTMEGT